MHSRLRPCYHKVTATSGAVQSYRGIIKLPGYSLQRRLDLKVSPRPHRRAP